ncbi:MAG: NADase-type glycan-binding domain-containing protein [bacterium]
MPESQIPFASNFFVFSSRNILTAKKIISDKYQLGTKNNDYLGNRYAAASASGKKTPEPDGEVVLIDTYAYTSVGRLPAGNPRYPPRHLFDGDYATCWVANPRKESGTQPLFVLLPENASVLNIYPGYGKSLNLYRQNARPARLKISLFGGVNPPGHVTEVASLYKIHRFPREQIVELNDTFALQHISLEFTNFERKKFKSKVLGRYDSALVGPDNYSLIGKIEILKTRRGSKYDDICISELYFNDRFVSGTKFDIPPGAKISINKAENKLLFQNDLKDTTVVYSDTGAVLQLLEISPDKKWVILILMAARAQGRVETNYLLVDMRRRKVVNQQLARTTGDYLPGNPLFFKEGSPGEIILEYLGKKGEYRTIELK